MISEVKRSNSINNNFESSSNLSLIDSNKIAARVGSWLPGSLSVVRMEDPTDVSRTSVERSKRERTASITEGRLVHGLLMGRSIP